MSRTRILHYFCRALGLSLVVKGADLWQACHESEASTAEDPPCRGGRCSLNISRLKHPSVGVVWKLGEEAAS
ncbi:hypothetical protein TNCV_1308071 [Trichonephila clavipes]|nr:hypothetical protein TNCV_1308071 [Trichonephila clavipes]